MRVVIVVLLAIAVAPAPEGAIGIAPASAITGEPAPDAPAELVPVGAMLDVIRGPRAPAGTGELRPGRGTDRPPLRPPIA